MKISVAVCTYNGEKFLHPQIDSILGQSVQVDEIVVCDDGSKDQTSRILSEYQNKFPGIVKVHINTENLRSVKNFEKAISLCTGDIIFLSDQDDLWHPDKVKDFLKVFEENPTVEVIASNALTINEQGKTIEKKTIWDIFSLFKQHHIPYTYFEVINLVGNIATGANMALRRSIINDIIPFPDNHYHHDEWIALVSSCKNTFYFIDDKKSCYRIHDQQQVGGIFFKDSEDIMMQRFNIHNNNVSFRILKRRILLLKDKKNKILSTENYASNPIFARMLKSIQEYENHVKNHLKKTNFIQYQLFKLLYF